jgi:hypothetical protein
MPVHGPNIGHPSTPHGVPSGATSLCGHAGPDPSHASATSHALAAMRHVGPFKNVSAGQASELPSQLSA